MGENQVKPKSPNGHFGLGPIGFGLNCHLSQGKMTYPHFLLPVTQTCTKKLGVDSIFHLPNQKNYQKYTNK